MMNKALKYNFAGKLLVQGIYIIALSRLDLIQDRDWTRNLSNRGSKNLFIEEFQLTYEERRKEKTKTYEGPEDRLNKGRDETKIF